MTAKLGPEGTAILEWLYSVPEDHLPGLLAHLEGTSTAEMALRDAAWYSTVVLAGRFVLRGAPQDAVAPFLSLASRMIEPDPDVTWVLGPWTSPLARYIDTPKGE